MTALTADSLPTTARPLGRRLLTIIQLQLTNPMTLIGWPLIILGIIFLGNIALLTMIATATNGGAQVTVNGGVGFIWIYTLVMAVQSVNQTFPLALGFGSTRRDYLLGTGALFVLLSAGYSALITGLAAVERATDYWGLGLGFFDTRPGSPLSELFLIYVLILLLSSSIGAATAAVYVRWKALGMYVFWLGLVIVVLGAGFLVTWTDSWGAIGDFFATNGVLGSLAWSLILTAVSSIAAYAILRRATPTNT